MLGPAVAELLDDETENGLLIADWRSGGLAAGVYVLERGHSACLTAAAGVRPEVAGGVGDPHATLPSR